MTAETKQFIETHIDTMERGGLVSTYLDCPLRILNEFNNILHCADIYYPPEIHNYVVLCCYISKRVKNAMLKQYDFDYKTEQEEYEFGCDNCQYSIEQLNRDLSVLLPKRSINADIARHHDFKGIAKLNIRIKVS